MKKIVFMLFLLAFSGEVLAESCAGGQGVVIVAVNGKKYCRSKISMNWWSSHAWCDAAEGVSKLVDPNEDCSCVGTSGCDTTVSCPNFKGVGGGYIWTKSSFASDAAYKIHLSTGEIDSSYGFHRNNSFPALCK